VGLSVMSDGYIACGSEDNCVYTYYNTMPAPLCRHSFSTSDEPGEEVMSWTSQSLTCKILNDAGYQSLNGKAAALMDNLVMSH